MLFNIMILSGLFLFAMNNRIKVTDMPGEYEGTSEYFVEVVKNCRSLKRTKWT